MNEERLVIESIDACYSGVEHLANIMVFVPEDRPFDRGDIAGDFRWRREHEQPFSDEEVLEAVRDTIIRMGHFIKRIAYSKYAGCGLCPCSPGYIIYTDQDVDAYRTAIWLKRRTKDE